jgi:hypothetical protein
MTSNEKYNLAEMLKEIEDDALEQKKDLDQEKTFPRRPSPN